jgi:fumarylacetoacetase
MACISFLSVPSDSDFPLENIPFGVARSGRSTFIATRIGNTIINLKALAESGFLEVPSEIVSALQQPVLNDLMTLGRSAGGFVRKEIQQLFDVNAAFASQAAEIRNLLFDCADVTMLLPVNVGDYTDFYSSREHATNVGIMFRGKDNALQPNWLHLPVGYHGRSSSIVVSGTPVRRPMGQTKADDAALPSFGPSRTLDFELETAVFIASGNPLGTPVSTSDATELLFGMVLLNDWSARDIQKWEYVPLGPFLAKNFASTISPWVVHFDALEPFRVEGPLQDPKPLPYLRTDGNPQYDIQLEVVLQPAGAPETVISRSNQKYLYWNLPQQLAHHTITGCNLRPGDMLGSGTISAPSPDGYGSLLELTWRGEKPLQLNGGVTRKFLQDGDTVIMRGYAQGEGFRVGFGECRGTILPANDV